REEWLRHHFGRPPEEHGRLHQQERRCRERPAHRRANLPAGISAGPADQAVTSTGSGTLGNAMDTVELADKGLKLRQQMFGKDAIEQRAKALGAFGEPLQNIINAYAYGDVWSRSALPLAMKSLAMVAMMSAAGRTNELRVHVKGALANGAT